MTEKASLTVARKSEQRIWIVDRILAAMRGNQGQTLSAPRKLLSSCQ